MNREQLKALLKDNMVRTDAYSLNGGSANEAYCIDVKDGVWLVYYSERGLTTSIKQFETESAACDYFYTWIMADDAVKE